jgi:drug/metabolite transporter (DMT)-like permease
MDEKPEYSGWFREIRYLLTSPRWTARLPRHGAVACVLAIPLLYAYCMILGRPQRRGDFPVNWRIAFMLFPVALALPIFVPRGHWPLKIAAYALVVVLACRETMARFDDDWQTLYDWK